MEAKQKQLIESYRRVQAFLTRNPAPAPATYAEPKEVLDAVVAELTGHSSAQAVGRRLSQAEFVRQNTLMTTLRNKHLKPIVAIARATMTGLPGIDKALRMPPTCGVIRLVAEATAIAEAATKYEPAFVKNGRAATFLEDLKTAIQALDESTVGRAANVGKLVGARAGILQELRRGRDAVGMLDTIVRVAFEGNGPVLREWAVARRVKALPSGGAALTLVEEPKAA
jgi:hypothetical protein